jgi:hypothetical protein
MLCHLPEFMQPIRHRIYAVLTFNNNIYFYKQLYEGGGGVESSGLVWLWTTAAK